MNITIQRSNDGFGSQLLRTISGLCYAKANGLTYLHTELSGFKLLDKPESLQNDELNLANNIVDDIVSNLGYRKILSEDLYDAYEYFYFEIYKDLEKYYNEDFLNFLRSGYTKEKPLLYKQNEMNIAIHIRRGLDILKEDIHRLARYVDNSVYEKYIMILLSKYPNAKIHIFSWTDPKLEIYSNNIIYHIVNSGERFIEDFNCLVHADILIAGSSAFSISAGMFNKNITIINDNIHKLSYMYAPVPSSWIKNSIDILGE